LTAQLKNSADIRMVMDVRDYLTHDTYFDEFVILSGDADFTPVLHRLRAHARRTVIFANDFTAQPYTAICDGEVRESDLLNLLLEGRLPGQADTAPAVLTASIHNEDLARDIIGEVVNAVRSAAGPMPLEALADRAIRVLGHDRTVGGNWAGTGGFRDLLTRHLPEDVRLTEQPPYLAFELRRTVEAAAPAPRIEAAPAAPAVEPRFDRAAFFASLPSASQLAASQPVVNIPAPVEQAAAAAPAPPLMTLQQIHAQQAHVSAQIAAQAQLHMPIPRAPASQSNAQPHAVPQADLAAYSSSVRWRRLRRRLHQWRSRSRSRSRNVRPPSRAAPRLPSCCSSQSHASTRLARRRRYHRRNTARCLSAWPPRLRSRGFWVPRRW
jgi:NYN domain